MTILAVTGMTKEAKIAGGAGVVAVAGGGDAQSLAEKLNALHGDIKGVISIGIAGALSPQLRIGDAVIASEIVQDGEGFPTDEAWRAALIARLPRARGGRIAGTSVILADASAKSALLEKTDALTVDMESHIAARFAKERGLPFAALRVISDDAHHGLPPAALVAMRPDGGIALGRVLWSLVKNPRQLPSLIRAARASEKAFAELLRCRDLCGAGLACPYL